MPRDVSELLYTGPGFQTKPAYWQQQDNSNNGYDYPRPGVSTRPVFRDPEPVLPEQFPVQTRPVYPNVVRPPYHPVQNYNPNWNNNRNPYDNTENFNTRVQPAEPSERILWPLINKIAGVFSGQGQYPNSGYPNSGYPNSGYPGLGSNSGFGGINYPGSNTIGYPGGNGQYPNKFPFNLFDKNYSYQRLESSQVEVPLPAPISVNSVGDSGNFDSTDTQQPGVSSIGDSVDSVDSVVVGAIPLPAPLPQSDDNGYSYPNPYENQLPPNLPDAVQFRVEKTNN